MNRLLQLFFVLVALLCVISVSAISQIPEVPPVVAPDNSFPVPGSVMVDPSNHPATYSVNSFFDIFTEVSLDFNGTTPFKPPLPNDFVIRTLQGTGKFQIVINGSAAQQVTCPIDATMKMTSSGSSGATRFFDTEMLSLNLSGGTLPNGMMIRESPTRASTGKMHIRESPSRPALINSFFDVFTELSVDGGQTWSPADGAIRLETKILRAPVSISIESVMPPGTIDGQITGDPDFDLLRITHNTQPPPPIPPPGSTSMVVLGGVSAGVVVDGRGLTPDDMTCRFTVTGTFSDGTTRLFNTEMLQLDISGGTLPSGTMIRESPSKQSLGRTSIVSNSGGGYRISSFFDVFLELSIDGGQSWTPQAPRTIEFADSLRESPTLNACLPVVTYPDDLYPPVGSLMSRPADPPIQYSNGMRGKGIIKVITSARLALPPLGSSSTYSSNDICDLQISPLPASPFQDMHATGQSTVRVVHSSDNGTQRIFDTEMLSLNLNGNGGGSVVMIRESPTRQSLGRMTVQPNGTGYRIDSFFDIFTEISLDGGGSWSPSAESTHVEQVLMSPASTFSTTNFPPPGLYRSSSDCSEVTFGNGALIRKYSFFDIFPEIALPSPGGNSTNPASAHSYMEVSLDGGNSFFDVFFEVPMITRATSANTTSTTRYFDTEMLSLNLTGNGFMLRESPTKQSLGKTALRESPTRISSFFDVFLELSVDGGQTWSPASSSMRLNLDSVRTGTITGMKWHDANGNGVIDGGETGIANWKIILADTLGNIIDTVRTNVAGNYSFSNVPPGTYRVTEEFQTGWIQTGGLPAYGFWMVPGDTNKGNDFGNFRAPDLTGHKFNDLNGDGVWQQPGEPGLRDWEICIFPKNIPTPGVEVSGGTGTFSLRLNGLPPGEPVLGTLSAYASTRKGWDGTIKGQAFENGQIPIQLVALELQSVNPVIIGGLPYSVSVKPDTTKSKKEFVGHVTLLKTRTRPGKVVSGPLLHSSFFDVFLELDIVPRDQASGLATGRRMHTAVLLEADLSGDGEPDPLVLGMVYRSSADTVFDDNGVAIGVLDSLTFTVGAPASQVNPICIKTDSAGQYSFSPMLPGVWNILEHQQPCWNQTTVNPGPIVVTSGSTIPQIDFGNHHLGGTIAVAKYYDINHNQNLDPNEPPMQGVTFNLLNLSTTQTLTQVTGPAGGLSFTDLPPGDYKLTEVVLPGYTVSVPKTGMSLITVLQCETTSVRWLNASALTDSTFRTATYEEWARALDPSGKRKAVKCKPDKVDFKFNVNVPKPIPPANLRFSTLELKFNMPVETLYVWAGKSKTQQMPASQMTFDPKRTLWSYDFTDAGTGNPPDTGAVIQFDGRGLKGKSIAVAYKWGTKGAAKPVVLKGALSEKTPTNALGDTMKLNMPRLPMPNLVNVGEDLQVKSVFPISIGFTGPGDDSNVVTLKKFADVLKALAKEQHGQFFMHDSALVAKCLQGLSKSGKPKVGLTPDKFNNKLFAQILTMKLNLIASRYGQFPPGLDTLIFDNHKTQATPFDGKSLRDILEQAEYFIRCRGNLKPAINATADDYYRVLKAINGAFSGPIDTISWSCIKIHLKGVRTLKQVPYLRAIPGTIQPIIPGPEEQIVNVKPEVYSLSQNYPNPFNPTTNIKFALPEQAVVTIKVYNMLGQEIATLIDHELLDDGEQELEFNAGSLTSGVYFYRIVANGIGNEDEGTVGQKFVDVKKMLLIK